MAISSGSLKNWSKKCKGAQSTLLCHKVGNCSCTHTNTHTHRMVVCQEDKAPTEKPPNWQNWNKLSKKEKKKVLDYNPKYRIIF